MKIIARSGSSYLVVPDDIDLDKWDAEGQVLDELKRLWPPNYIDSILARGYWDRYEPDSAEVVRILEGAIDIPADDRGTVAREVAERAQGR